MAAKYYLFAGAGLLLLAAPNRASVTALTKGIPFAVAWKIPNSAGPYLTDLRKAELMHGLPAGLLVRVAYQESHFRADIISGDTMSAAGAIGIMQIVPRWHPDVNPYDPIASIYYSAGYLKRLHDQFGNWPEAVAAYNWGPGNVKKHGLEKAPEETRNYIAQIGADVALA